MLEPSQKIGLFFSQAIKKIDGITAYFFSIISLCLVVIAKFFPEVAPKTFILKVEKDLIFICFFPLVMLVSYAWLNSFSKASLMNSIFNAVLISILPLMYFFKILYPK